MACGPAQSVIRGDLSRWEVQLIGRWTGRSTLPLNVAIPLSARYNSEGKFLNSLPDLLQSRALSACTTFTSSDGEEVLSQNLVDFFLLEATGRIIISPC